MAESSLFFNQNRHSNKLNTSAHLQVVDHDQEPPADVPIIDHEALYSRMPMSVDLSAEQIRACRSPGDAFKLACWASALDDKEIYGPVGIDPGYFTNIKKGIATLKADKEPAFCKAVGNYFYPEWRAFQHGCVMVKEPRYQELLAAERRAKELELRLDTAMSLVGHLRPA